MALLLLVLLLPRAFETIAVPPQIAPFVEKGTRPILLEKGDLDGDGISDCILVLEEKEAEYERRRILRILLGTAAGGFKAAKRSESAVRDDRCGGTLGDCLQGVIVTPRQFVIGEYGGSGWRWSREATFRYSRRDRTWQLVEVTEQSFHVGNPEKVEVTTHKPPRDFGKIDIEEYDAFDYLGKGPK
jgi:hypothetical protein